MDRIEEKKSKGEEDVKGVPEAESSQVVVSDTEYVEPAQELEAADQGAPATTENPDLSESVIDSTEVIELPHESEVIAGDSTDKETSDSTESVTQPASDDAKPQDSDDAKPQDSQEASKGGGRKKKGGIEELIEVLDREGPPETRLRLGIDFMRDSVSQQGNPRFRDFWELRRKCLLLFKENLPPPVRVVLWNEYSDLCTEARRLKEMFDEQSAFAVEQIEIAIAALEKDLENADALVERLDKIELPRHGKVLEGTLQEYEAHQRRLNFFNTCAARINSLRKELIKTDMRIRHKNQFFQRLSVCGDQVFPHRKELIRDISENFTNEVTAFVQENFSGEMMDGPLYFFRDAIKTFQTIAKILTLNTESFSHTRSNLSECWDRLRGLEKDHKKVRAEVRTAQKGNCQGFLDRIAEATKAFEAEGSSARDCRGILDEIGQEMRQTELGRDDVKLLRDGIQAAKAPMMAKLDEENRLRQEEQERKTKEREEERRSLETKVQVLCQKAVEMDVEVIETERDALTVAINECGCTSVERQRLEKMLKGMKDILTEKREEQMLALSEDDKELRKQLKAVLAQRKERKQEIKAQLQKYRRASGSSSLDFEKAIAFTEMIAEEKERLVKADEGIAELEKQLKALGKK